MYYLEMQKLDFSRGFMTFAGTPPPIVVTTPVEPEPTDVGVQAY